MQRRDRNVMRLVKLNKDELLKIVCDNRIKHIAEYDEAVEDYKVVVLKLAKENLKLAKTADLSEFKKTKNLPASPNSYAKDYDRAIRMLELSVETEIEVEEDVFNQLVLDEWGWKQSFVVSNAMYKSFT